MVNKDEFAFRIRLKTEFPFYAEQNLKIRVKLPDDTGAIKPLILNKAQLYLHKEIEHQKATTGKVRVIIMKGRQQGCSTYVGARFYHLTTHNRGVKSFILTHRKDATENLYKMVQRYHDNCLEQLKPSTSIENAKTLYFDKLDSGYEVGTAGSGTVGRSDTIQYFHGSEVAYWDNTDELAGGIMQAIPDMAGTEIILESTANGIGNYFHKMAIGAIKGTNGYKLIFIPWFWQEEYRLDELPENFVLTEEEQFLKKAYGLDDHQLAWRRKKINEFPIDGESRFKREYPNNYNEAFEVSGVDRMIKAEHIAKAMKRNDVHKGNQLIVGVDPAREGDDSTGIVFRSGKRQWKSERIKGLNSMAVVGRILKIITHFKPAKVFIDRGGEGGAIYDRLIELGYKGIVVVVNFGLKADDIESYPSKRVEMYGKASKWFAQGDVQIEDDEYLQHDLLMSELDDVEPFDSLGRPKMMKKSKLKKKYSKSPDLADAFVLTFAYPVPDREMQKRYGVGTVVQNQSWSVYD